MTINVIWGHLSDMTECWMWISGKWYSKPHRWISIISEQEALHWPFYSSDSLTALFRLHFTNSTCIRQCL